MSYSPSANRAKVHEDLRDPVGERVRKGRKAYSGVFAYIESRNRLDYANVAHGRRENTACSVLRVPVSNV